MKRPKLVINIAILLVLSACGNSGAQAREYDAQYSQVSEIEQQSDVSKDTEIVIHEETDSYADNDMEEIGEENDQAEEAFTDEMFDLSALTPMEAFWKVLLSEAPFSCRFISSVYHGYLEDMPYYSKELVIDRFTVMDMDGDEMPEILLEVDDYMGYILLRYHEGSVDGYEIGYRAMYDIKTDGSFTQSNGAGDWRISRLFWVEDIIYYDEILNVQEGETYENYYIHDLPVDKWSMESFMELHNEKEQPEWYNFNDEMILEIVNDTEYSMEAKQFLNERQQYLDSFYYLIE